MRCDESSASARAAQFLFERWLSIFTTTRDFFGQPVAGAAKRVARSECARIVGLLRRGA